MEAGLPLGSAMTPLMATRLHGLWLGGQHPQERGTGGSDKFCGHSPPVGSWPAQAGFTPRRWLRGTSEQQGLSPRGPPRSPVLHSHQRWSPGHLLPGFKTKG